MPATLTESQISDLTKTTLRELGWLRFNQIAQKLQSYEAFSRIFKSEKVQEDSGWGLQRDVMVGNNTSLARNVGLYAMDKVMVPDVMQQIQIDWRHNTSSWAIDRREISYNTGREKIVSLITTRRTKAMLDLVELWENMFWSKPASSTDLLTLWGVLYWIVWVNTPASTSPPYGFNGTTATGFSAGPGGLSPTTYPAWCNWCDIYTNITKNDLIYKMRVAAEFTDFKSPVDVPDFRRGSGQDYRWYCSLINHIKMCTVGESQNENLGRDLASMDGMITFRRNPVVPVAALNVYSTSNPFYGLNWSWFHPIVLRGEFLRESEPIWKTEQHTVQVVHIDTTMNVSCTDRRRQIVIAQADPQNGD